jgi:hypothetical protein
MVWVGSKGERRRTRVVGFIWRMWVIVTGSMRFWRGSEAVRSSWGTEPWITVAIFRLMVLVVVVVVVVREDGRTREEMMGRRGVNRNCVNIMFRVYKVIVTSNIVNCV